MFEVSFTDSAGNVDRHIVKLHWIARQIAKDAARNGARGITVRPLRTDVWLVDAETGTMERVARNVSPRSAASLGKEWIGVDRRSGMLLWPSECSMPRKVKIARG